MNPTDFPRVLPTDALMKIGSVLTKSEKPTKQHLFPAYVIQGYIEGLYVGGLIPEFGDGFTSVSDEEAGRRLIELAESGDGFAADEERDSAALLALLPAILNLVAAIIRKK